MAIPVIDRASNLRCFHRDPREQAYADYEADLTSAYKMDAGEGTHEGEICTVKNAEYPNDLAVPGI